VASPFCLPLGAWWHTGLATGRPCAPYHGVVTRSLIACVRNPRGLVCGCPPECWCKSTAWGRALRWWLPKDHLSASPEWKRAQTEHGETR
jgi:hypothetical protein